jgi:hypothetical protein
MTICVMQPFNYVSIKNTNTKTNTKDYQTHKRTTQIQKQTPKITRNTKEQHKQRKSKEQKENTNKSTKRQDMKYMKTFLMPKKLLHLHLLFVAVTKKSF